MKPVATIGGQDDLIVVCSSFEVERSIRSVQLLSSYSAKVAVVVSFTKSTTVEGERLKRQTANQLLGMLRPFDSLGAPRLLSAGPYAYRDLVVDLADELLRRGVQPAGLSATVDASCLTRLQLVFLVANLACSGAASMLRVLYTVPARYHTSEHDKFTHLAVGAFRPISLPLRSWVGHGPFTTRRAAIVLLGHEGQRTLAAVRRIDPDDMLLVFAKSGDEDLEATCAKQNAQLIERVRSGQCRGETLGLPRLDIQGARSGMGAWLDKFSAAPGCVVSLVPLGPKPLVVAAVLALLERATLTSEVVYPLASRYNPHYSEGTAGTFSVELCLAAPAPQTTWSRPVDWGM